MNQPLRTGLALLTCCILQAPALAVAAENAVDSARTHAEAGDVHFRAGRFDEACVEFTAAFALLKWPTIGLDAARSHVQSHRLVEAANLYRQTVGLQPDDTWPKKPENRRLLEAAKLSAQAELTGLLARIPTVQLQVTGAAPGEFELSVDAVRLTDDVVKAPLALNPGQHTILATAKDGRHLEQVLTLAEGEQKTLTLDGSSPSSGANGPPPRLQNEAPRRPVGAQPAVGVPPAVGSAAPTLERNTGSSLTTLGWVAVAIGAGGIGLGTTAGIVSIKKKSELEDNGCNDHYQCNDAVLTSSRMKSYDSWRTVSTVGFVAGGVLAAAGITLLIVTPRQPAAPRLGVAVTPATLAMVAAF